MEVEDLLVLKNNKGTEENRVRHMDYGVQFNKLSCFMKDLIQGNGQDYIVLAQVMFQALYEAFLCRSRQV